MYVRTETNHDITVSAVPDKFKNPTMEMLFVGCLYKEPDLYLLVGGSIKSAYDFTDEAMRFYYDFFSDYYTTFSQQVEQVKVNSFALQRPGTFKTYEKYGGYKTIQRAMNLADPDDYKGIYNILKKYALVREYYRKGFPAERIVDSPNFEQMTANDIYRAVRANVDRINSDVNVIDDPIILNEGNESIIDKFLEEPRFGIKCPWVAYNQYFRGLYPSNVLLQAFKSNEGKSRNVTFMLAYVTLVERHKCMMLSNEMTESAIRSCLLVTVISNPEFQRLHGETVVKTEEEITMGWYRDDNTGEFITRETDGDGNYIERYEDFLRRVKATSEYQAVQRVAKWMNEQMEGKFYFKDITADYSDTTIDLELRKAKAVYGCDVFVYDTAKTYGQDDWRVLKATVTNIVEIAKEIDMAGICTFQLSDESENIPIFEFNSMQLANCKQVRHVVDCLTMGRKLKRKEYKDCQYYAYDDWGTPVPHDLDPNKDYFAIKIDKNRMSRKGEDILLFQIDLDINRWDNIGTLVRKV